MACSMDPVCPCHRTVCVRCSCLHDPCGRLCAVERRLLLLYRQLLRRIRSTLT